MEKIDIIKSLLSAEPATVTEAKTALRELLDARAASFREDSTKFVTKSLFEGMTFDPPGFKVGATVDHAGAQCIIDRIDGDNLILKPIDSDGDGGGSLYSVSKSDVTMTRVPPGVKHAPAGTIGNGLYKDDSNKGMIFTPPGGAGNANTK